MKVKFISLASGSSGNCYYIGTEKYGILIDAGIAVRTIKKGLKEAGISMEMIRAVFVTHDHADHIKAVGGLGEKLNIPISFMAGIPLANRNMQIRATTSMETHADSKNTPCIIFSFVFFIYTS